MRANNRPILFYSDINAFFSGLLNYCLISITIYRVMEFFDFENIM